MRTCQSPVRAAVKRKGDQVVAQFGEILTTKATKVHEGKSLNQKPS
jgi:hypothetical protein